VKGAPDFAVSCHILPVVQGILLRHCQQLSVHDFFSVLGGWKVFLSLCDGIPLLLGGSSCHCCLGVRDLEISTWKPLVSASLVTLEMTIHTCLQVECHCCPTAPHPTLTPTCVGLVRADVCLWRVQMSRSWHAQMRALGVCR
jgi:hypothetical protein